MKVSASPVDGHPESEARVYFKSNLVRITTQVIQSGCIKSIWDPLPRFGIFSPELETQFPILFESFFVLEDAIKGY